MSKQFPTQTIQLPKGLTREEALKACKGKVKKDFRGFTYDPKTGRAKLT